MAAVDLLNVIISAKPVVALLALIASVQSDTPARRLSAKPVSSQAASEPIGRVTGRIRIGSDAGSAGVIVYLEALDPKRRFEAPRGTIAVRQRGAKFSPSFLVVSVGQTVEFPNDEDRPVQHNVFAKSPAKPFDLGLYGPGDSKLVRFDKPGVVRLHCSIHRQMDGSIYVCPTPFFARVASDGRFEIADVPVGAYELRTWQRKRRFLEGSARVEVVANADAVVNLELHRY